MQKDTTSVTIRNRSLACDKGGTYGGWSTRLVEATVAHTVATVDHTKSARAEAARMTLSRVRSAGSRADSIPAAPYRFSSVRIISTRLARRVLHVGRFPPQT